MQATTLGSSFPIGPFWSKKGEQDLEKGLAPPSVRSERSSPFWKKTVAAVSAALAFGAILYFGSRSSPPPDPHLCNPETEPNCSGPLPSSFFPSDSPSPTPLPQRTITIGTVYDNRGNAIRGQISDLVNQSHHQYARKWGLIHKIVNRDLVAGRCQHPITNAPLDCNAYLNKLQRIREWLLQPKDPHSEEWLVYLDDDMPITNMRISIDEIIDKLRGSRDPSVIMAEDLHDWQKLYSHRMGPYVPHASINSGLILIRKDEKARDFMERVWSHRNDPIRTWDADCLTLGQCKGTIDSINSLLDQEMVGTALAKDPSLMDSTVLVVPPRDDSSLSRRDIALNTLTYRNLCFSKCVNGMSVGRPGYFAWGDSAKPHWTWEKGDFCGQPAGVYRVGKEFPLESHGCPQDSSYVPCTTPRLNRIREMIRDTIY